MSDPNRKNCSWLLDRTCWNSLQCHKLCHCSALEREAQLLSDLEYWVELYFGCILHHFVHLKDTCPVVIRFGILSGELVCTLTVFYINTPSLHISSVWLEMRTKLIFEDISLQPGIGLEFRRTRNDKYPSKINLDIHNIAQFCCNVTENIHWGVYCTWMCEYVWA